MFEQRLFVLLTNTYILYYTVHTYPLAVIKENPGFTQSSVSAKYLSAGKMENKFFHDFKGSLPEAFICIFISTEFASTHEDAVLNVGTNSTIDLCRVWPRHEARQLRIWFQVDHLHLVQVCKVPLIVVSLCARYAKYICGTNFPLKLPIPKSQWPRISSLGAPLLGEWANKLN